MPVLVVGLFAGHELGHRFAHPDPAERARELGQTGHGYFSLAPYGMAVLLAVGCIALALRVRGTLSGRPAMSPSWTLVVAPVLVFTLLETTERLRAGELALSSLASRQVVIGLLLQLPFALAALLVARLLVSLADALVAVGCRGAGFVWSALRSDHRVLPASARRGSQR